MIVVLAVDLGRLGGSEEGPVVGAVAAAAVAGVGDAVEAAQK